MKIGRPSSFKKETAETICGRIAGGESLRAICRDDDMPTKTTVMRWLAVNDAFRDQYAQAREIQIDEMAEEILDIADDGSNDWMVRTGKDQEGGYAVNGEHVQRSRLRIDSRKWLLAKMAPKKYSEKVTQELTGPDGGPVQVMEVKFVRAE